MATRALKFATGEFYHVYNRGTDKRPIFQDEYDHCRFVRLLYLSNNNDSVRIRDLERDDIDSFQYERGSLLVHIGAYCLMPNHFHILLTPLVDDGVSRFMRKIGTGYSMYFNTKYERTGTLFEGKFKAKHADTDDYLKYLYAYIHLNPQKVCKREGELNLDSLRRYEYSSLPDYLGQIRPEATIVNRESFPNYFRTHADHFAELQDWLTLKNI